MAKIMIDIPDDQYNYYMYSEDFDSDDGYDAIEYICNGTVLPDNATNGDVIKVLFGEGEEQVVYSGLGSRRCIEFVPDSVKNTKDAYGFHTMGMIFAEDLWNAPYKAESKGGEQPKI